MALSDFPARVSGFEWKIKDPLSTDSRESDEFVLGECRWRLRLTRNDPYVQIFLSKLNSERSNIVYTVLAFVEDPHEKPSTFYAHLLDDPDLAPKEVWRINKVYLRNEFDMYLTDGTLTFVIVFTQKTILEKAAVGEKVSDKSIQTSINMDAVANLENLSLDLRRLLDNGVQSDVTLKCAERSFPAHKNILSARSEIFSAMFRSDMAESRTCVIQISDVDTSILDQFLHYLYSGKLPDLSMDTVPKLYAAADKCSIESLKKSCSMFMQENLTKENVCKILVLADTFADKCLKDAALCFITNVELLRNNNVWSEFHNEHPMLASEVIHHAYEAKCLSSVKLDTSVSRM